MIFKHLFPQSIHDVTKSNTKAKVLVSVILFSLLICLLLKVSVQFALLPGDFPLEWSMTALIGLLFIFRYTNSISLTANLFFAIIAYFQFSWSLDSGGIYSLDLIFLIIIPLAAYVLSEVKSAVFWFFIVNLWAVYLFTLANSPESNQLFREQTLSFLPSYYLIFLFTLSIFIFGFLSIFYYENQQLIKKLKKQQADLVQKNTAYSEQTKQLEQMQKRLENSNKELEQYAYVTSHDLKQPIRTINGFANLLQRDMQKKGTTDAENREFLDLIIKSSNNMERLVNDLLSYAKLASTKEEVPFRKIPLDEVVNEVLINLQNQIDSNKVQIERTPLPTAEIIPTKINQVFQNIISNAIKFKKKTEPLTIKIYSEKNETHSKFTIEDNGIGIEKKHQEKIFTPFQKLHSKTEYEGSGIGLATCKRIIDLHNGKLWVESEKNMGTKFVFTLPRSQAN